METRQFGNSTDQISLLGFGSMRLPILDGDMTRIDRIKSQEMVDLAIAKGVNYFDTAWLYHGGHSETALGELLSGYSRDCYYLADKMPVWMVESADDVERVFFEQLKKCRVEYFDYYLMHNLSQPKLDRVDALNAYNFLVERKRQGQIRHLGFSFHDGPEVLKETLARYDWDFAQIQLNYLDWDLIRAGEMYNILTEQGLPVAVMEPVRGGALATLCPESLDLMNQVTPDVSPASWALRFAGSLPNVYTVLSGMSNREQVLDNLQTMTNFRPLNEAEKKALPAILAAYQRSAPISCTGCGYCSDCPAGIDIPRLFTIYNHYLATNAFIPFIVDYFVVGDAHQPHRCVKCDACLAKCPQHLAIPELLANMQIAYEAIEKPDWYA